MKPGNSARGGDNGEQYVQSLLFARYTATSSPDNGGPNNAPPSSSKKPPTASASPYSQGRPAPSGFGARGDLSLASPEPAPLSASGTRPRARAPPRKSVLDERNGIFGSSTTNFSALKSPGAPRGADNPFLLSPVGRAGTEPRAAHQVGWEGEDIDGDLGLGSSKMSMGLSGAAGSEGAARPGAAAVDSRGGERAARSPGTFGRFDLAAEQDGLNIYGDARNPMALSEAAWQRWVVVFGFKDEADAAERVLELFQRYGQIDKYVVSSGNWLFIRYVSPLDAHGAEQDNGSCYLSDSQMLGVIRLSSAESSHRYRAMLEDALASGAGGRHTFGGGGGAPVPLLTAGTPGRAGPDAGRRGTPARAEADSALRHRREGLGSAAYRQHFRADMDDEDEQIIMRVAPRRKKDICTRVYEFFFLY